jgi:hypothetical protein
MSAPHPDFDLPSVADDRNGQAEPGCECSVHLENSVPKLQAAKKFQLKVQPPKPRPPSARLPDDPRVRVTAAAG